MGLVKNFNIPVSGSYSRIFVVVCSVSFVLLLKAGVRPSFAFSQEEAALEKLKSTAVNFHEAASGIYRSGLITEEAVPLLKQLGVKTVISFDNNSERAEKEKKFLERAGIESILIPWSAWDYPKDEVVRKTLELMELPHRKPVLVHCKHGQERTGVALACWRIVHQQWPADEAYREMKSHGFRRFRYGHLRKYVYDFARAHGEENVQAAHALERAKTSVLSFIYQLRKLNPFLGDSPA